MKERILGGSDDRTERYAVEVGLLVAEYKPDVVVIEVPSRFVHLGGGTAERNAVVGRAQSITKQALVCGAMIGVCAAKGVRCVTVEPRQWKGHKTKAMTRREVEGVLGRRIASQDAIDACGLWMWYRATGGDHE